jgi:hypothetical protein
MLVFPKLDKEQDSRFYEVVLEDVGMKSPLDGGYVASRPKHTRRPRRSFKTGYSKISNADRATLEAFYTQTLGSSIIFEWCDPVECFTYQVRFAGPMSFKYVGMGVSQLWEAQIQLEQV